MIIPSEHREAYRQLYEAGILRDMLSNIVTELWKRVDATDESCQGSRPVFLLRGALLEVLHNPDDFVKVFWPRKPRARKKQQVEPLPGQGDKEMKPLQRKDVDLILDMLRKRLELETTLQEDVERQCREIQREKKKTESAWLAMCDVEYIENAEE